MFRQSFFVMVCPMFQDPVDELCKSHVAFVPYVTYSTSCDIIASIFSTMLTLFVFSIFSLDKIVLAKLLRKESKVNVLIQRSLATFTRPNHVVDTFR